MPTDPPIGWYSRGYHPHLNTPGLLQFVTFHLADSIPPRPCSDWRRRPSTTTSSAAAGWSGCWMPATATAGSAAPRSADWSKTPC